MPTTLGVPGIGARLLLYWEGETRKLVQVLHGHRGCVYALAWNATGSTLATASTDGTVKLWGTTTWLEIGNLDHRIKVYGVAFSPNGKLLATACDDHLVRIWDVRSGNEIAALRGHADYVHAIAFSPDGKRLVSASGDKTLRVWDTETPASREAK